jgi:galactose mutarotase-like enzyme
MDRDHLVLQNTSISITVRPGEGGRIASLRSLHSGLEFLTQSHQIERANSPSMDASFRDGPCAGIEECLPTVGVSSAETQGGPAPDHGDFWQLAWEAERTSTTEARLHAEGFSRRLRFTKHLALRGNALHIRYNVQNTGAEPQSFLYACHPLLSVEEGDRVVLPNEIRSMRLDYSRESRLGVRGDMVTWPQAPPNPELDVVKSSDAGTAEMFYTASLDDGRCALYRCAQQQALLLSFDTTMLPFLGVWLCYGGWPGGDGAQQYAVALEPTTSPYNTLVEAQRQGSAILLRPHAQYAWGISFEVTRPGIEFEELRAVLVPSKPPLPEFPREGTIYRFTSRSSAVTFA